MSSIVASLGRLIVFDVAPLISGCTAAIILMWPVWWMYRSPSRPFLFAVSKTARCSASR